MTGSKKRKRILIVEDDRVLADMLQKSLEREGFLVRIAENGEEGIRSVREEGTPDLLLIDIDMPKMDGIIMLGTLRKAGMKAPAMILTNMGEVEHVADAAESGALEYLVKADWELDEIVAKIKSRFAVREHMQP